ncbi:hypothetical protein CF328_g9538 [Tilletia controversa]|nr:hypothetical protein CF328_g9538 [Tilletia controversa]
MSNNSDGPARPYALRDPSAINDDWVPSDLLTNLLQRERDLKEAARNEKKRKRRLMADKARKKQKTALAEDEEE